MLVFIFGAFFSFSLQGMEFIGMSFSKQFDYDELSASAIQHQSTKKIVKTPEDIFNFVPQNLQQIILLNHPSLCKKYNATTTPIQAIPWPHTSLEKSMFPFSIQGSWFRRWLVFDDGRNNIRKLIPLQESGLKTIWKILKVIRHSIVPTEPYKGPIPTIMIAGPNKDREILCLQGILHNETTLYKANIEEGNSEILTKDGWSRGLFGILPKKTNTSKIYDMYINQNGAVACRHHYGSFIPGGEGLLNYNRNMVLGEKKYKAYKTKALFINEDIFFGLTGPNIFLYDLKKRAPVWGEFKASEIAKFSNIQTETKKCVFGQLHHSKKFPNLVFVDLDIVDGEKVTRCLIGLKTSYSPEPFLLHCITFERKKKSDGYRYTKNHAIYRFDPHQVSDDLYLDQCNKRTYLSSPTARHVTLHGYPRGLADKVIDLTEIVNHYYEHQEIDIFLKIELWKMAKNDEKKTLTSTIIQKFKQLPLGSKWKLFAQTSIWTNRDFDPKKQKTYSKIVKPSILFDILKEQPNTDTTF